MRRVLGAVLVATVIPLIALIVVYAANTRLEADWITTIVRQVGPQPAETLDRVRLSAVCVLPDVAAEFPSECLTSGMANALLRGGLITIGLSLGTLVGIVALRGFVRRDRRVLTLFRPALLLLLLALVVLVILDGALVAGAAYLGESVFFGSIHPLVILGVGAVAFLAAAGVLRAAVTMGRSRPIEVRGLILDRDRDRDLFAAVDDVAKRVESAQPDQIVAGLDPTFFVTEGSVAAYDGTYRGRTLFLSIPFARILSRSELIAVIGHELGHFRGADTVYSERFYPVYRGSIESLDVLRASADGWGGIALIGPFVILDLFFQSFAEAERSLSRQRELAADLVGAEAASPSDAGVALVKMEAFQAAWIDAFGESVEQITNGQPSGNLSRRFAELALRDAQPGNLADVDQGRISHPTDSHPPTSERLRALGIDVRTAVDQACTLDAGQPAIDLIDGAESLESDLMDGLVAELAPRT